MSDVAEIVCGADGVRRLVDRDREGWWVVMDLLTKGALSGGFKRRSQAKAEAARLALLNHMDSCDGCEPS